MRSLTQAQRFTIISSFMFYFLGGLFAAFFPRIGTVQLNLDVKNRDMGYFILSGSNLAVIGFCLMTLALAGKGKDGEVPKEAAVLGTIFNRLVLVNCFLGYFYRRSILSVRYVAFVCVLDSSLALITYAIWIKEHDNGNLLKFFVDLWNMVNPYSGNKKRRFLIFQALGAFQAIICLVAPDVLLSTDVVAGIKLGSHAEGCFRLIFAIIFLHGIIHVTTGGTQIVFFPTASLFYRLAWNIPLLIILGFMSFLPFSLVMILVIYDLAFSAIIVFAIPATDHGMAKTKQ